MDTAREDAPKSLTGMDTRSRRSLLNLCLETVHKTDQTCKTTQEKTGEKGKKTGGKKKV